MKKTMRALTPEMCKAIRLSIERSGFSKSKASDAIGVAHSHLYKILYGKQPNISNALWAKCLAFATNHDPIQKQVDAAPPAPKQQRRKTSLIERAPLAPHLPSVAELDAREFALIQRLRSYHEQPSKQLNGRSS